MRWCMLLVLIELIHVHELGDTHSDVYSHLDCCMGVRLVMDGWVGEYSSCRGFVHTTRYTILCISLYCVALPLTLGG